MDQLDTDIIVKTLEDASNEDMLFEVVTTALKYMKDDPSLEISEALAYSYNDWIK